MKSKISIGSPVGSCQCDAHAHAGSNGDVDHADAAAAEADGADGVSEETAAAGDSADCGAAYTPHALHKLHGTAPARSHPSPTRAAVYAALEPPAVLAAPAPPSQSAASSLLAGARLRALAST